MCEHIMFFESTNKRFKENIIELQEFYEQFHSYCEPHFKNKFDVIMNKPKFLLLK